MNLTHHSILRIIGIVLIIIGASMLPSFVVSLVYDSFSVSITFILISAISVTLGYALVYFFPRNNITLKLTDGFLIVTLCWIMSAALGALPFTITGSIPNPIDAFFESASGFSTTGATILDDIEVLPKSILFWRSFTHWLGGMGILIFAIALMPSLGISGQNIATAETPGPTLDKTSPKMSDTARALYVFYIFFTIAETVLLMFGGMNLYDALVHTFGTVGTGGFSPYNDSVAHFDSTYIKMVITAFMVLCGVNFNLYFGLFKKGSRNILADAELKLYIFIIVLVTALIFAALLITGEYSSVGDAAVDSSFQTVSILTTTGYTTANYENWPVFCQMLILILMFIGGCSSSTSGGIKIIRIMVILKLIKRGFAMRLHPNVVETVKLNGRTMPSDTVSAISSHLFLYIAMVFVGAFIISFENVDIITCFSSVITCLGNIGPGFGLVGPANTFAELSGPSKLLLSLYMIAGRLELYTLFILFTPRFWSKNN